MFAQTFCEAPPELFRRKWTTLASFFLEALAVLALITAPLLHVESLPPGKTVVPVFTPIVVEPVPIPTPVHNSSQAQSPLPVGRLDSSRFMQPRYIPSNLSPVGPAEPPPIVPFGNPNAPDSSHAIADLNAHPVAPVRAERTRVSQGVMEGALMNPVQPVYPRPAIMMHLEGTVLLRAIISRTGTVENLQVIQGSPFLSQAAIDAVRQWHYRPYRLNNEPVEVETQILVKFTLAGR